MLAIAVAIEKAKWYQQKSNSNKSKKLKYDWNHFQKEPHEGHIWALGPDFGTTYSRNDGWWWTFFFIWSCRTDVVFEELKFWVMTPMVGLFSDCSLLQRHDNWSSNTSDSWRRSAFFFSSKLPVHMYLKLTGVMKGRGNSRGSALKETDRQINIFPDWTE